MLRTFLIERAIPGVGGLPVPALGDAAATWNAALARMSGIQWQHSYILPEGTACLYLADSEATIRAHALRAGLPATRITEVLAIIDPTSERESRRLRAAAGGFDLRVRD